MAFPLLAPENEGMKLGQGFNSFLQHTCIDEAVKVTNEDTKRDGNANSISQVVSYSSRFVERLSDVVRSMNISAGSSIKSGTVISSGNSSTVDEMKFNSSDLNAVISVKVMNATNKTLTNPEFLPLNLGETSITPREFFEIYGDCYISGFVEGGELHAIVSMRILNVSKKSEIETALKSRINTKPGQFVLADKQSRSQMESFMSETETTITVNWSGGGQIKPEAEEWSLDTLFRTAAGFPSHVANCPQRTWAILTPYTNNRNAREWLNKHKIAVPTFSNVMPVVADLLDMYMQYKCNLVTIQTILNSIGAYKPVQERDPIALNIVSLIKERKEMKDEMKKIVQIIDDMNSGQKPAHEASSIKDPDVWAARLPVLAATKVPVRTISLLDGLPLVSTLCSTETWNWCTDGEKNELLNLEKNGWKNIRVGFLVGFNQSTLFVDLPKNPAAAKVPKQYIPGTVELEGSKVLGALETVLEDGGRLKHGGTTQGLPISGDRIVKVEIGRYKDKTKSRLPAMVRVTRENGEASSFIDGVDTKDMEIFTQTPPSGTKSLLGFWGSSSAVIDRIGPIWL